MGREQGMPIAEILYSWWDGYASVVEGRYEHAYAQLAPSVKYWRDSGALHLVPYANLMMAQALSGMDRLTEAITLVDEAVQVIERTNHRPHEAEVHRVRGMLLSQGQHPNLVASEAALRKAIDVARSQQAKGWELRAATSLARIWQTQEEPHRTRDVLAPVYNWFTEGFDTRDLREAKALLDELRT